MFPSPAYRSPKLPGAWVDAVDHRSRRVSSRPYSSVSQSADDARSLPRWEIVPRVSALLLPPHDVHSVLYLSISLLNYRDTTSLRSSIWLFGICIKLHHMLWPRFLHKTRGM